MKFPELTFTANLCESLFASEGGKIVISDETVTFVPHALNFDIFSQADRTIEIKDIIGYKKGWFAFFTIYVKNRLPYKISTYKKDTIMMELERRRAAYYKERGMEVPSLMMF